MPREQAVCAQVQCIQQEGHRHTLVKREPQASVLLAKVNQLSVPSTLHSSQRASCYTSALLQALGSKEDASQLGAYANLFMNGGEVFKFAVRAVPTVSPRGSIIPCVS